MTGDATAHQQPGPPVLCVPTLGHSPKGSCLAAGRLFFLLCPTGSINFSLLFFFPLLLSCDRQMGHFDTSDGPHVSPPTVARLATAIRLGHCFTCHLSRRAPACRDAPVHWVAGVAHQYYDSNGDQTEMEP